MDVINLKVLDEFSIIGRGIMLLISLKDNNISINDLHIGGLVSHKNKLYKITGIEAYRTIGAGNDTIGINVKEVES